MQHLFTDVVKPARSKQDSQQATLHVDRLLFPPGLDKIHSIWKANPFLDQSPFIINGPQELVKEAIDAHSNYNTTELDRSREKKTKYEWREEDDSVVAVNSNTTGSYFVGKVKDV